MRTHVCTGTCARCASVLAALPAFFTGCAHAQSQGQALVCWHTEFAAQVAGVPHTIRSLSMLELASCRRLCSVTASHREGIGNRLAEFVLIITQVVTKSGMS